MDDEMFQKLVAEMEARNRKLAAHRDDLRLKAEAVRLKSQATLAQDRQLSQLDAEERNLQRQIAALEGRPHQDQDDEGDHPEPPVEED